MVFNTIFLTDWHTRWTNPVTSIELIFLLICFTLITLFLYKLLKQRIIYIFYPIVLALDLLSFILEMNYLFIFLTSFIIISTIIYLFINLNEVRSLINNSLNFKKKEKTSNDIKEEVTTKEDIYKKLETTVKWLSSTKTGALITIERKMSLSSYIKTGTIVNAPVTPELLETIFYEGTRLHDGAVVIRNNKIYAASVFYPSSSRGLTGKYGARHRAALGISELTDSVTIIVSEETGRVAIAYNGTLESIIIDEFLDNLKEAMDSIPVNSDSK